ncbi:MAG: hypothetical protein PUP93_33935 [Rhizonema sp. NSF051]|nr:hypothetical protein [Rhizonema sp. NSF051]
MRRIIAAIAGSVAVSGVVGGAVYLSYKPAHSSTPPQLNPALLKPVTIKIPSNKNKDRALFALPSHKEVSGMMTARAKQHVQSTTMMNFGDYEKNRGRKTMFISAERQVWVVKEKYKDTEEYAGLHGKFKGATVTTLVDAETGNVMSQDIDYQKGNYTPTSVPAPIN